MESGIEPATLRSMGRNLNHTTKCPPKVLCSASIFQNLVSSTSNVCLNKLNQRHRSHFERFSFITLSALYNSIMAWLMKYLCSVRDEYSDILFCYAAACTGYDGEAADVWALGVMLFQVVTGDFPFPNAVRLSG